MDRDGYEELGYNQDRRGHIDSRSRFPAARMMQRIRKMTRTVAVASVILALVLLASSCRDSYQKTPPSLMLLDPRKADVPPTGATAPPAQQPTTPPTGRAPAVLFVAYATTPPDVIDRMLKLAGTTKNDVVYDLGSGDGRIVITAAKKYRCRGVGYDLDPLRVAEAQENARKNRVTHLVTIERQDILKTDLRAASVVTLYLGPEMNARLIPQLRKLRPGTRVVSHEFGLGDIPPDKTVELTSRAEGRKHTLYLWTCPLAATGD